MKIKFTKPSGKSMSISIADEAIKAFKQRDKFIEAHVKIHAKKEVDKPIIAEKLGEMYDALMPPKTKKEEVKE